MAEKRMFSRSVVTSDAFLDMPADAQALYFQLNIAADDRGFCDRPRMIMRMMRASDDTMKILISKKFVLIPDSNNQIVVIKHWRINNNMRTERFKETKYIDVLGELYYDENKSYSKNPGEGHYPCLSCDDTDLLPSGTQAAPKRLPSGAQREPQNRIDKNRLEQSSLEENSIDEDNNKNNPIYLSSSDEKPAEKNLEDRRAYYQKHITWYRQNNINTEYLLRMAADEGITDL